MKAALKACAGVALAAGLGLALMAHAQGGAAGLKELDVLGIKLGALAPDIKTQMTAAGYGGNNSNYREQLLTLNGIAETEFLSTIWAQKPPSTEQQNQVGAAFTGPGTTHRAYMVARATSYWADPKPLRDNLLASLVEKFGQPTLNDKYSAAWHVSWIWNAAGQLIRDPDKGCHNAMVRVAGIQPQMANVSAVQNVDQLVARNGCARGYYAAIGFDGRTGMVNGFTTVAYDFTLDQAGRAATGALVDGILDKRAKDALAKSRAVTPDL